MASHPAVLIAGAVINCLGTGVLLPSLVTAAMSRLDYADRGRGTGLWTAAFFLGEFVCPVALIGVAAAGSLAGAVVVLGAASAATAAGLWLARRRAAAPAEVSPARPGPAPDVGSETPASST